MSVKTKALLSVASAIVLALGAATAASAQGLGGGSFYVKGLGGFSFPQDDDFDIDARDGSGSDDSGFDFDTGYTLSIAGGYMLTPNIGLELEYAYRNAQADIKGTGSQKTTESNAWMVNALYAFSPMGAGGRWTPYAGAGLGVADLNVDEVGALGGGDFDSDYNFAYQAIGGVAYDWTPNLKMNVEARFFGINDQDVENGDYSFKTTYHTFDLLFGATYSF